MYLSRLFLNPRSRQVQRELANPYEMHRTILRAFPASLPADERVLYRLEVEPRQQVIRLLVQSRQMPDWRWLAGSDKDYLMPETELPAEVENPAVKPLRLNLSAGQALAFRLCANPTVKKDRPGEKQGRRVGLFREEDQFAWLRRKLEAAGARLVSARASRLGDVAAYRRENQAARRLTFFAVQFDGILAVVEPEKLQAAVMNGIGSGKGLGFGLLSLAPAREADD